MILDITNFMSWFLNQFATFFTFIYNTLDNITFFGVSLLSFSITCILMGVIITTLTTLPHREKLKTGRSLGKNESNSKSNSDDN